MIRVKQTGRTERNICEMSPIRAEDVIAAGGHKVSLANLGPRLTVSPAAALSKVAKQVNEAVMGHLSINSVVAFVPKVEQVHVQVAE